jgi:hypothetical protein
VVVVFHLAEMTRKCPQNKGFCMSSACRQTRACKADSSIPRKRPIFEAFLFSELRPSC